MVHLYSSTSPRISSFRPMAEESQELTSPSRTTGGVLPKKPRKRHTRTDILEPVYRPRIWVWWIAILVILQLVGFCACRPPSGGYYYRQRLFSYLSPLLKFAQACLSTLIKSALQIMLKYIQDNLLSWISRQWRVSQDGCSRYVLTSYLPSAPESPPRLARGNIEDSCPQPF